MPDKKLLRESGKLKKEVAKSKMKAYMRKSDPIKEAYEKFKEAKPMKRRLASPKIVPTKISTDRASRISRAVEEASKKGGPVKKSKPTGKLPRTRRA